MQRGQTLKTKKIQNVKKVPHRTDCIHDFFFILFFFFHLKQCPIHFVAFGWICLCLSFVKSDKWPTKPGFVFHITNYKLLWQKLTHSEAFIFIKMLNMRCTSFPLHLLGFSPLLFAVEEAVSLGRLNQNWRAMTWAVLPELIYCMAVASQTYY